jgi:lipopolysaccharide transport system ATP-binding protein
MGTVIRLEGVGKTYRLRHQDNAHYTALRDVFAETLRGFGSRLRGRGGRKRVTNEDFWALRDISLVVEQGERLGVIGRNGAGKSTLLKLLSRITAPSLGRISLKGRVGSLLEVGTGFHPELTGRENIFLNGAILGMGRQEIKKKFAEIVAFAEVEKFLDTPVKRYSSGMYVRLAFAVAAHLDTDILLVDEVLAVGDAQFQKKCLGKMEDITRHGRTILFVSHNMNAIGQICNKAILLDGGRIKEAGAGVDDIIRSYLFGDRDESQLASWENKSNEYANPYFTVKTFRITGATGKDIQLPVANNADMAVQIEGVVHKKHPAFSIGYALYSEDNVRLYATLFTDKHFQDLHWLQEGRMIFRSQIPKRFLNEGTYRLALVFGLKTAQWIIHPEQSAPSIFLKIKGSLSDSPYWTEKRPGLLAPLLDWESSAN